MSLSRISETFLQQHSTAKSYDRGMQYYRSGAVANVVQRGNLVQASVEGSEYEPYCTRLTIDSGGIREATCTCEYSYEGWCKHIIAVGLFCLHQPQQVVQGKSLEEILASLDLEQTRQLIQQLVEHEPTTIDFLERQSNLLTARSITPTQKQAKQKRKTTLDPKPFAAQVRSMIRHSVNGWEEGWDDNVIDNDLAELLQPAEEFSHHGDGRNAIVILDAMTGALVEGWDDLTDYGCEGEAVLPVLDPVWAKAILTAELEEDERIDLQVQLEAWGEQLGGEFQISTLALRQGWDDEDLLAVLAGESEMLWEDEPPEGAQELANVRLEILEQTDRLDEYLNLAYAEGKVRESIIMLIHCDRTSEAMTMADQVSTSDDAFEIAQALREAGAATDALLIAERGLPLPRRRVFSWDYRTTEIQTTAPQYQHYELGRWAGELAEGLGQTQTALQCWTAAWMAQASLKDYQHLQTLAGKTWSKLRQNLLKHLRQTKPWIDSQAKVDIFLAEGLVKEAIAIVAESHSQDEMVLQVMQAAIAVDPEWVIHKAQNNAERIIEAGKANKYDWAVKWLQQMKAGFSQLKQVNEWNSYKEKLIATHGRKRKLMDLMAGKV
jgi:uncharacterized Zn finger protein